MDYGLFTMPSHPPERKLFDGHQWDLQQLRWADELGFSEAWIGEHHTSPWEPHPSPDLLVVAGTVPMRCDTMKTVAWVVSVFSAAVETEEGDADAAWVAWVVWLP